MLIGPCGRWEANVGQGNLHFAGQVPMLVG